MTHRTLTCSATIALIAMFMGAQPVLGRSPNSWNAAVWKDTGDITESIAMRDTLDSMEMGESPDSIGIHVGSSKQKRELLLGSVPRRVCGAKLVKAVVQICNGCIRAPGMVKVESKRTEYIYSARKNEQSITRMCCANPCTKELIESHFCC
ncbi:hypothetical protein QR680_001630 [Steinernema hermaphroditum]|uniref:Insulin-like domain-containing protein n=1 Tax=Steinernema hermaphroditum TaxID=289476 RepID=A0AA39LGB7_9BILA|nr:hypothetical protein QR680_001630 [Steinernema hermaphroditum]